MKKYRFEYKDVKLAEIEMPVYVTQPEDIKRHLKVFSEKVREDFPECNFFKSQAKGQKLVAYTKKLVCVEA